MLRRKHTRCGGCHALGHWQQLEVMWRLAGNGPWTWIGAWLCASCRASSLETIARIGVQLVLWDG